MFTGIVECQGEVLSVIASGSNLSFWIRSILSPGFKEDQSVSHDGICLTVEEIKESSHKITAVKETLEKTNIKLWSESTLINLERSLVMNGRLDGHLVQGHVDDTATCLNRMDREGSSEFTFSFDSKFASLIIEKGSITVNGVSLTAFDVRTSQFTVAIIPYTLQHTNFNSVGKNSIVNLEFDMIGKYVVRLAEISR